MAVGDPRLELALVLSIALLFSPIAWEHYFVWLLFAAPAATRAWGDRVLAVGWVIGGVLWVLMSVPTEWLATTGGAPLTWVRTMGLGMTIVLMMSLIRTDRSQVPKR